MPMLDYYAAMKARKQPWYSGGQVPASPAPAPTQPPVNWNDQGQIAAGQGAVAGQAGQYGQQATGDYWNRISSFDPTAAVNRYAQGTWNQMKSGPGGFDESLGRLKGSSVGAGRLDTGFFDEDTGSLYRSTVDDFGNQMARTALDATRMQMDNTQAIGQFGDTQTERNLDLGVARREELINDAREKAERKRKKKKGIAGAIGGLLGAGVGSLIPGVGTMVGAQVGSMIGGGFGGGEEAAPNPYQQQRQRSRYGFG
jgi:hypothetical protein